MSLEGRRTPPSFRVIDFSFAAVIAISITGILFFLGLPVITGALAEDRGLASAQLGALASIATGTTFLSSIFVTSIVARARRRVIMVYALLLLAGGYCGFIFSGPRFSLLALSGIASGLGGGACYSMCLGILSGARNSVRVFSILLFFQVIVTGAELAGLPFLARSAGVSGVFAALASTSVAALLLVPFIPEGQCVETRVRPPALRLATVLPGGLCLAAVTLFYIAIGSLWTFVERIGVSLKLSSEFVGGALSLGNLLSLLGTLIAVGVAARLGVNRALLLSLAIFGAALAIMGWFLTIPTFLAGAAIFFLFWNLIDIFQATTISHLDAAGRLTALIPAAQSLGNTLGPVLAGIGLGSGRGYSFVLIGASVCVAASISAQLGASALSSPSRPEKKSAARH
jgi:predicted MFS family arabinose efflux permease